MQNFGNLLFIIVIGVTCSCHHGKRNNKEIPSSEVTMDENFNRLFHRDAGGATGADGTISVPLPDGSSIFMMGDSFLGEVNDNQRDTSTKMINNTFIIVDPLQSDTRTLFQGEYNDPFSFVHPENEPGKFYWPGHGFVRDSIFHFFMSKFWTPGSGMWGFEFLSTDYFRYSLPDFRKLSVTAFDFSLQNDVHWGHAVLDDDTYIYMYGSRAEEDNICRAHVCRAIVTSENGIALDQIEFFDGTDWTTDPLESKPMQGTSSNISEQFSVFKYRNVYVMLSQQRGIGAGEIYTYTATNPHGPWENKSLIYKTTEQDQDGDIITYNAMAHPQYIENGNLLISYNVNSLKGSRIFENANNYRPVFLRVPMGLITCKLE